MVELTDLHKSILERYGRPIVHLRRQINTNRFGLVIGAGLSRAFGLPNWYELVHLLAQAPEIRGEEVLKMVPPRAGLPYQTEMLFEHYRRIRYEGEKPDQHHTRRLDYAIGADWREIIRKHLYAKAMDGIGDSLPKHPYLATYLPLIKRSYMTVNYNFDDFVEQALLYTNADKDVRGFETVTNPWTQFRATTGVIYHPNGVIPQNSLESPSDTFVFSEASYAEQLMGIYAGEQAGLANHFSKHTCLFIGLSLEDETLRSVLMQNARTCPGNFHYYIHFTRDGDTLDEQQKYAIRQANFKVYNLITLFLGSQEIKALGEMLDPSSYPCDELCDFAQANGIDMRYRFYVTGPLGVGKSTAINHFRNLAVYDEWLDERPPVLAKDWKTLTSDEKDEADKWIIDQFGKKNAKLRNEREGVFMLDRGPLDPLAFTPAGDVATKSQQLLDRICPNKAWDIEDGRVILLQGESQELALRMVMSQRDHYTADKLKNMGDRLSDAYGDDGVTRVDTQGLAPADVARRIAEIIHLEDYRPVCNLHERLEAIQKGVVAIATD